MCHRQTEVGKTNIRTINANSDFHGQLQTFPVLNYFLSSIVKAVKQFFFFLKEIARLAREHKRTFHKFILSLNCFLWFASKYGFRSLNTLSLTLVLPSLCSKCP